MNTTYKKNFYKNSNIFSKDKYFTKSQACPEKYQRLMKSIEKCVFFIGRQDQVLHLVMVV